MASLGLWAALGLGCGDSGSTPRPNVAAESAGADQQAHAPPPAHPRVDSPEGLGTDPAKRLVGVGPGMGRGGPLARLGSAPEPSAPTAVEVEAGARVVEAGGLRFEVAEQWAEQSPANRMRLAQFDLPGPGGGASLVLYRFPGGGGDVESNIARWGGQFETSDGTPALRARAEHARAELKITTVHYAGAHRPMRMGRPAGEASEARPDYVMHAAIVRGRGDPFFFKLLGPASTVSLWVPAWERLVASIEAGASEGTASATGTAKGAAAAASAGPGTKAEARAGAAVATGG